MFVSEIPIEFELQVRHILCDVQKVV
jgi:hypothetical protein